MSYVDMHMHSTYSDGEYSVSELFDLAQEKKLKAIVLTDHDCFDGFDEAMECSKKTGIETIVGSEISTMYNNKELHLLAYGFDLSHRSLAHQLLRVRESRVERAEKIVANLGRFFNLSIDFDRVIELGGKNPGRPHIARVLLENGYVKTVQEAFDKYLNSKSKAHEAKLRIDIERIIQTIHHAGGVCAIAHCGRYFSKQQLLQLIKWGMDGIEVYHPSHGINLVKDLKKITKEYGLLETGGSDFHGNRVYSELGSQKVDSNCFYRLIDKLN